MKIARVEYTVRTKGQDGETISGKNKRVLSELKSIEPDYIQQVLEQVMRASGQAVENSPSFSLLVTNITELFPTDDDD